tara:strand:- start:6307 stop:8025 length:1719 start_codon:yes stop_codon:yes gene_type:complete
MVPKKLHFLFYILLIISTQSCKKELQPIPKKKSNLVEIKRLIALGDHYFENGKYDSSYYYFDKAKLACDPKKDINQFIYAISNLATIQQNQGDFSGSETTAMEAMPVLQTTTNLRCKWSIYTILGINYLNTFDYDNALYYYNKALNLKTDQILNNGALNNIALTYMQQEEYQKALKILLPMTLDNKIKNDPTENSRILNNIGYCYFKTGNPKTFDYLTKSLKIRKEVKDDWSLITSFYNLSLFYEKYNPNLSREYAQLSYDKATMLNNADIRLESLKLLIRNNSGNSLKTNSIKYMSINDSIKKVRQEAKNQFAKIKYDSKKEKDENLKLKEQKVTDILKLQAQKSKTQALYFVILIILILTGLIYFYLKSKNRREKIQAAYTTEIKIAKKLHDELANDLYQMITFAETQDLSTENNKETLLHNLDTIYLRTRNISKENSYIETGINFIPTLKAMLTDFNSDTANVLIHDLDCIEWIAIENTIKITLYRILQELLVNMKKHSNCNLVVISFKLNNDTIDLNYSDNGIGVKDQNINKKNGLQNVENRILAIKGTITFDTKSEKGFKVKITFPI